MRTMLMYSVIGFLLFSLSCTEQSEKTITGVPSRQDWEPISFEELTEETLPPCLHVSGISIQVVLRSHDDYEQIRRAYAPQGEYVYFDADGIQNSFQLPYQPLDVNGNGAVDACELIIYVRDKPLYAEVDGELIFIFSNPIHIRGDSIFINTDDAHILDGKIHYQTVFMVDPATGEITFHIPPQAGSTVSMCSQKKLHETYAGRLCSMEYFDFSSQIIIGKSIVGNGCLYGFEKKLFVDHERRQLIYLWRKIEIDPENGCPEVATQYTSWVACERPPDDYEVIYVEDPPVVPNDE